MARDGRVVPEDQRSPHRLPPLNARTTGSGTNSDSLVSVPIPSTGETRDGEAPGSSELPVALQHPPGQHPPDQPLPHRHGSAFFVSKALGALPKEKRKATRAITWSFALQMPVLGGESVPAGCLSSETSDQVVRMARKGGEVRIGRTFCLFAIGALFGPVPATLLFCVWPLVDPTMRPVWDHHKAYLLAWMPLYLCANSIAFGVITMVAMDIPRTRKRLLLWTFICVAVATLLNFVSAMWWAFPQPLAYLWIGTTAASAGLLHLALEVYGWRLLWRDRVRIGSQIGIIVAALIFLIVFVLFRMLFSSLTNGRDQALVAPLWPLLKIAFKSTVNWLAKKGNNPDFGPLANFMFDAWAALCGNFLFVDAADASGVAVLVLLDVCENVMLTIRCVFLDQKFQKWRAETKAQAHNRALSEFYQDHCKLRKEVGSHWKDYLTVRRALDTGQSLSKYSARHRESIAMRRAEGAGFLDSPTATLFDDDEDEEIGVEGIIHRNRSVHQMLLMVFSELSEIVCSAWACLLLATGYYGPNKAYIAGMDKLDDEGFSKALMFSVADFAAEVVVFLAIMVVIQLNTGMRPLRSFAAYLDAKNYWLAWMCTAVVVPILTVGFFFQPFGIDPTFQFTWLNPQSALPPNQTAVFGNRSA